MKTIILLCFLAVIVATVYGYPQFEDEDELEVEARGFLDKLKEFGRKVKNFIKKAVRKVRGLVDHAFGKGTFNRIVNKTVSRITSKSSKSFCSRVAKKVVNRVSKGKIRASTVTDTVCDKALQMAHNGIRKLLSDN